MMTHRERHSKTCKLLVSCVKDKHNGSCQATTSCYLTTFLPCGLQKLKQDIIMQIAALKEKLEFKTIWFYWDKTTEIPQQWQLVWEINTRTNVEVHLVADLLQSWNLYSCCVNFLTFKTTINESARKKKWKNQTSTIPIEQVYLLKKILWYDQKLQNS